MISNFKTRTSGLLEPIDASLQELIMFSDIITKVETGHCGSIYTIEIGNIINQVVCVCVTGC